MRTNIVLDDELISEASRLTGIRTKRELVREGLKALIRQQRRKSLLDLRGTVQFDPKYDYKGLRRGRG